MRYERNSVILALKNRLYKGDIVMLVGENGHVGFILDIDNQGMVRTQVFWSLMLNGIIEE